MSDGKNYGEAEPRTLDGQNFSGDAEATSSEGCADTSSVAAVHARVMQVLRDARNMLPPEALATVDEPLAGACSAIERSYSSRVSNQRRSA